MKPQVKVSTSTNLCNHVLWTQETYESEDAIRLIAEAGYGAVDLDLAFWRLSTDYMAKDNWKEWVERQRDCAREAGLSFSQGHAHFFALDHCELLTEEERAFRDRTILRDIEAAGLCGVKWLVLHPESYCDSVWYSHSLSLEKNRELFARYGEAAAKYGVGIAIENMFIHSMPCFAASSEDLIELLDRLGDDSLFGLCWDTGHGNLNKVDQPAAVRQMGRRLKALHINDNHGQKDEHILPFAGTICWQPFMEALEEIGYEGDFTYEIHNFSKGFDQGFHQKAVVFARELGEYMLTLGSRGRRSEQPFAGRSGSIRLRQ